MAQNTDRAVIDIMRRIARLEAEGNYSEASVLRKYLVNPRPPRRTYTPNLKKLVKR